MKRINLLDLFSGIGGFHKGLEQAGFKVNSHFSEIDKHAISVYQNNFKKSHYVGSVTNIRGHELPRINAITFGSPCQDFSIAGKRKGMEGARSSLILEAIRLIRECRPNFFIWENVKGTFSSNNREDFAAILQAFANIGGYRLEWQLLNTKWFLPQNRERIYLVGYTGGRSGRSVFPIGKINKNFTKEIRDKARKSTSQQNTHSRTISSRYHKMGNDDTYIKITDKRGNIKTDQNNMPNLEVKTNNSKGFDKMTKGDSLNYSNPNSKIRRGRVGKGVAQTLDTACSQATIVSSRIRRLTPIECERLQGFPDNWTQYGTEGLISDTQRYKMCGNAVTVNVVQAVAEKIFNLYNG
jgi:DNA (cytosine-5)-methyltransferase 1